MKQVWSPGGKGGGGKFVSVYDIEDIARAFDTGREMGVKGMQEAAVAFAEARLRLEAPPSGLPERMAYQHVGKVQALSWSLVGGIVGTCAFSALATWAMLAAANSLR